MMKRLLLFVFSIVLVFSLYAKDTLYSSNSNTSKAQLASPFKSVAYHGDFLDFLSNPASLALMDSDQGSFMLRLFSSDNIPISNFSKKTGYMNDMVNELSVAFAGKNIAFVANVGTSFERKSQDLAIFDIFSNIDIEVDWAFSFPYVSLGMSIKGGNSLVRYERPINNVFDAISNAWFSPFESSSGKERFSLGSGLVVYFDYFSFGLNIDGILSLDERSELVASWSNIARNSSISFASNGSRFTKDGDLFFILPRVSISFSNFDGTGYTFSAKTDFTFQFLPDCNLSLGVGYMEVSHSFFSFNKDNGNLDVFLKGRFWDFSLAIGLGCGVGSFDNIAPFVGFSYIG